MKYSYRKLNPGTVHTNKKGVVIVSLFVYGTLFYYVIFDRICKLLQNDASPNDVNYEEQRSEGFVVKTSGCKIPDFQPFERQILKYIKKPPAFICNEGKPPLFKTNLNSIYLLNSSLSAYNISNTTLLDCCYNVFWRVDPSDKYSDTKIAVSDKCNALSDTNIIEHEFIKVTCLYNDTAVYKDVFSFVPIKNIRRYPPLEDPPPLNVLIVGLDSVSRLNLHRQMPNAVNYLKSIGAIEMLGYNKVGDNAYPNLIPVLTGLDEEELNRTCVPNRKDHFDNCSFIWDHFGDQGFVTAYGEDAAYMGLFNNFGLKGFKKQPTDYGYSYFSRFAENEIGNNFFQNVNFCQGSRFVYKDFLEYIEKFVVTMDENYLSYFAFFWEVSLSHDDLNVPSLADDEYYELFKKLKDGKLLENTAVIFMSDHGIRWGSIRKTYQGRMEERLPFVFILLPEWFKNAYTTGVRNLMRNVRKLTTPFDLHETLLDFVYQEGIPKASDPNSVNKSQRGVSLFKEISEERTCEDAGIASYWCTCQESSSIPTDNTEVIQSTYFAVKHINGLLNGYAQCANLTLTEISNAQLMTHKGDIKGKYTFQDYMVTFVTVPGNAIFEATVRYIAFIQEYKVIGTISRLNLYRQQSSCITDFHLGLYCFCRDEIAIGNINVN